MPLTVNDLSYKEYWTMKAMRFHRFKISEASYNFGREKGIPAIMTDGSGLPDSQRSVPVETVKALLDKGLIGIDDEEIKLTDAGLKFDLDL